MLDLRIFSEIEIIQHLKSVMGDLVASLKEIAVDINIAEGAVFVAAILFALTAGVFGYRLLKFICAAGFAAVGYVVGSALFDFLLLQEGMADLPPFLTYVIGGVVAVLFFVLGFFRFRFVLFAAAYTIGYNFIWGFFGDRMLALGGALLLAILCVIIVRVSVILLSSFLGSFVAVTLIGQMMPADVTMIQIQSENDFAFILALGVGLIFALLQFLFARFYKAE